MQLFFAIHSIPIINDFQDLGRSLSSWEVSHGPLYVYMEGHAPYPIRIEIIAGFKNGALESLKRIGQRSLDENEPIDLSFVRDEVFEHQGKELWSRIENAFIEAASSSSSGQLSNDRKLRL